MPQSAQHSILNNVVVNFSVKGTDATTKHAKEMGDAYKTAWDNAKQALKDYQDSHAKASTPDYDKQVKALKETVKNAKKDFDAWDAMFQKGVTDYQQFMNFINRYESLGPKNLKGMTTAIRKTMADIRDLKDESGKPLKENEEMLRMMAKAMALFAAQSDMVSKGVTNLAHVVDRGTGSFVEFRNAVQAFEKDGKDLAKSAEEFSQFGKAALQNKISMHEALGEWKALNAEASANDFQKGIASFKEVSQWAQRMGIDIRDDEEMMKQFNAMLQHFGTKGAFQLISETETKHTLDFFEQIGKTITMDTEQQLAFNRAMQAGRQVQMEKQGQMMESGAATLYGQNYEKLNQLGDEFIKQEAERWKKQRDMVARGTDEWIRYNDVYQRLVQETSTRKMNEATATLVGSGQVFEQRKAEVEATQRALSAEKEGIAIKKEAGEYIFKNTEDEKRYAEAVERVGQAEKVAEEIAAKRAELAEKEGDVKFLQNSITETAEKKAEAEARTLELQEKEATLRAQRKPMDDEHMALLEKKIQLENENKDIQQQLEQLEQKNNTTVAQGNTELEQQKQTLETLKKTNAELAEEDRKRAEYIAQSGALITEQAAKDAKAQLATTLRDDVNSFLGMDTKGMTVTEETVQRLTQRVETYKDAIREQVKNGIWEGEEQRVVSLTTRIEVAEQKAEEYMTKGFLDSKDKQDKLIASAIGNIEGDGSVVDKATMAQKLLQKEIEITTDLARKEIETLATKHGASETEQALRRESLISGNAELVWKQLNEDERKAKSQKMINEELTRTKAEMDKVGDAADTLRDKLDKVFEKQANGGKLTRGESNELKELEKLDAEYDKLEAHYQALKVFALDDKGIDKQWKKTDEEMSVVLEKVLTYRDRIEDGEKLTAKEIEEHKQLERELDLLTEKYNNLNLVRKSGITDATIAYGKNQYVKGAPERAAAVNAQLSKYNFSENDNEVQSLIGKLKIQQQRILDKIAELGNLSTEQIAAKGVATHERLEDIRYEISNLNKELQLAKKDTADLVSKQEQYETKVQTSRERIEELTGQRRTLTDAEKDELRNLQQIERAHESALKQAQEIAEREAAVGTSTGHQVVQVKGLTEEEKARKAELEGVAVANAEIARQLKAEKESLKENEKELARIDGQLDRINSAKDKEVSNQEKLNKLVSEEERLSKNVDKNELATGKKVVSYETKDLHTERRNIEELINGLEKKGENFNFVKYFFGDDKEAYAAFNKRKKMLEDLGGAIEAYSKGETKGSAREAEYARIKGVIADMKTELQGLGKNGDVFDLMDGKLKELERQFVRTNQEADKMAQNKYGMEFSFAGELGKIANKDIQSAVQVYAQFPAKIKEALNDKAKDRGLGENITEMNKMFIETFKSVRYQTDTAFKQMVDEQWKEYTKYLADMTKKNGLIKGLETNAAKIRSSLDGGVNKDGEIVKSRAESMAISGITQRLDNAKEKVREFKQTLAESLRGEEVVSFTGKLKEMARELGTKADPYKQLADKATTVFVEYDRAMKGSNKNWTDYITSSVDGTNRFQETVEKLREATNRYYSSLEKRDENGNIIRPADINTMKEAGEEMRKLSRDLEKLKPELGLKKQDEGYMAAVSGFSSAVKKAADGAKDSLFKSKDVIDEGLRGISEKIADEYKTIFSSVKFQQNTEFQQTVRAQMDADKAAIEEALRSFKEGIADKSTSADKKTELRQAVSDAYTSALSNVQNINASFDTRNIDKVLLDIKEGNAKVADSTKQTAEAMKVEESATEKALNLIKQYNEQKAKGISATDNSAEIAKNDENIKSLEKLIGMQERETAAYQQKKAELEAQLHSQEEIAAVMDKDVTKSEEYLRIQEELGKVMKELKEVNISYTDEFGRKITYEKNYNELIELQSSLIKDKETLEREIAQMESKYTTEQLEADKNLIQSKESLITRLKGIDEQLEQNNRTIEALDRAQQNSGKALFSQFSIEEIKSAMGTWQEEMRKCFDNEGKLTRESKERWNQLNETYQMAAHYLKTIGDAQNLANAKTNVADLDTMWRKRNSLSDASLNKLIQEYNQYIITAERAGESATKFKNRVEKLKEIQSGRKQDTVIDNLSRSVANIANMDDNGLKNIIQQTINLRSEMKEAGKWTADLEQKLQFLQKVSLQRREGNANNAFGNIMGLSTVGSNTIQNAIRDMQQLQAEYEKMGKHSDNLDKKIAALQSRLNENTTTGLETRFANFRHISAEGVQNLLNDFKKFRDELERASQPVDHLKTQIETLEKRVSQNTFDKRSEELRTMYTSMSRLSDEGITRLISQYKRLIDEMTAAGQSTRSQAHQLQVLEDTMQRRTEKGLNDRLASNVYAMSDNGLNKLIQDLQAYDTQLEISGKGTAKYTAEIERLQGIIKDNASLNAQAGGQSAFAELQSGADLSIGRMKELVQILRQYRETLTESQMNDPMGIKETDKAISELEAKLKSTAQVVKEEMTVSKAKDVLYSPTSYAAEEYNKALAVMEARQKEVYDAGHRGWVVYRDAIDDAKKKMEEYNLLSKTATMENQFFRGLGDMSNKALAEQLKYWQDYKEAVHLTGNELVIVQARIRDIQEQQAKNTASDYQSMVVNRMGNLGSLNANQLKEMQDIANKQLANVATGDETAMQGVKDNLRQIEEQLSKTAKGWMSYDNAMKLADATQRKEDGRGLAGTGLVYTVESLENAKKALEEYGKSVDQATEKGKKEFEENAQAVKNLENALKGMKAQQGTGSANSTYKVMSKEEIANAKEVINLVNKSTVNDLRKQLDNGTLSIEKIQNAHKVLQKAIIDGTAKEKEFADGLIQAGAKCTDMEKKLKNLNQEYKFHVSTLENAADRLKNYVLVYIGFQQAVDAMRGMVSENAKLSDSMAAIQKVTDMTDEDVKKLTDDMQKFTTKSTNEELQKLAYQGGKLGITLQGGERALRDFVEAAEEVNTALGEEFGGTEAITKLTKLGNTLGLNQKYGVNNALKATGSAILDLGNSSVAGYAAINNFATRMGSVGATANMTMPEILALGATIDTFGASAEMAGTAMTRFVSQLATNPEKIEKALKIGNNELVNLVKDGKMMDAIQLIFNTLHDQRANLADISNVMKDLIGGAGNNSRAKTVLSAMANSADELNRLLGISRQAFDEALEGEASVTEAYERMNATGAAAMERISNATKEIFVNSGFAKLTEKWAMYWAELFENWDDYKGRIVMSLVSLVAAFNASAIAIMMQFNRVKMAWLRTMVAIKASLSTMGWGAAIMALGYAFGYLVDWMGKARDVMVDITDSTGKLVKKTVKVAGDIAKAADEAFNSIIARDQNAVAYLFGRLEDLEKRGLKYSKDYVAIQKQIQELYGSELSARAKELTSIDNLNDTLLVNSQYTKKTIEANKELGGNLDELKTHWDLVKEHMDTQEEADKAQELKDAWDKATEAVEKQSKVVGDAIDEREKLRVKLRIEQETLAELIRKGENEEEQTKKVNKAKEDLAKADAELVSKEEAEKKAIDASNTARENLKGAIDGTLTKIGNEITRVTNSALAWDALSESIINAANAEARYQGQKEASEKLGKSNKSTMEKLYDEAADAGRVDGGTQINPQQWKGKTADKRTVNALVAQLQPYLTSNAMNAEGTAYLSLEEVLNQSAEGKAMLNTINKYTKTKYNGMGRKVQKNGQDVTKNFIMPYLEQLRNEQITMFEEVEGLDALYGELQTKTNDYIEKIKGNAGLTGSGDKNKGDKGANRAESQAMIAELDRYYETQKTVYEGWLAKEKITKEQYDRLMDENEAEHLQKRSLLRSTFTKKIYDAETDTLRDMTQEEVADFQKWWKQMYDAGKLENANWDVVFKEWLYDAKMTHEQKKALDEAIKKNNLDAQKDLTDREKIYAKHVENVKKIFEEDNAFLKMFTDARKDMFDIGALVSVDEMSDYKSTKEIEVKRITFLMNWVSNVWTKGKEDLIEDIRKSGDSNWADYLMNHEDTANALMIRMHNMYDSIEDAIKKEVTRIKRAADIKWENEDGDGMSMRERFEEETRNIERMQHAVEQYNSAMGAGYIAGRQADKMAVKALQSKIKMQKAYLELLKTEAQKRIDTIKAEMDAEKDPERKESLRKQYENRLTIERQSIKESDKALKESMDSLSDKMTDMHYKMVEYIKSWGDWLKQSIYSVMDAYGTQLNDKYDDLAVNRFYGTGETGGTVTIIDNAGTKNASVREEYMTENERIQWEIDEENREKQQEAWKNMLDSLSEKLDSTINDMVTSWADQQAAQEQMRVTDLNTQATDLNTRALDNVTNALDNRNNNSGSDATARIGDNMSTWINRPSYMKQGIIELEKPTNEGVVPDNATGYTPTGFEYEQEMAKKRIETIQQTAAEVQNLGDIETKTMQGVTDVNKKENRQMTKNTSAAFSSMMQAANLYGIAYQAVSNENLSAEQKVAMIGLQAAGQAAMAALSTDLTKSEGEVAAGLPGLLQKCLGINPIAGAAIFAALTALLGAGLAAATSQVAKSKSKIASVTGASSGKLATGMLTYAGGKLPEVSDGSTVGNGGRGGRVLRRGVQPSGARYTVTGNDGVDYSAAFENELQTKLYRGGAHFGIFSEKRPEIVIGGADTAKILSEYPFLYDGILAVHRGQDPRLAMNFGYINRQIELLSQGRFGRGSLKMSAFDEGTLPDMVGGSTALNGGMDEGAALGGSSVQMMQTLGLMNELLQDLVENGVSASMMASDADKAMKKHERWKKRMGLR